MSKIIEQGKAKMTEKDRTSIMARRTACWLFVCALANVKSGGEEGAELREILWTNFRGP